MSRKFLLWAMALVIILPTVFGVGYWAYWNQFQRYAPVTITNAADIDSIQRILDRVDYVSPDYQKPILVVGPDVTAPPPKPKKFIYLVTYRTCEPCRVYEDAEFRKLWAGGVETRVIPFALPDNGAVKQSTPDERSTIAELWLNRSWALYMQWRNTAPEAWKADAIPSADDDMARSGVVWASREFIDELSPLLRNNKVNVAYPLIIWRNKNNELRVCSCTSKNAYHFVRQDLGLPGDLENDVNDLLKLPNKLLPFGNETPSSAAASSTSSSLSPMPGLSPGAKYGPEH